MFVIVLSYIVVFVLISFFFFLLFCIFMFFFFFFFFQAEDGIRDHCVTGVQTCAHPIYFGRLYRPLRKRLPTYSRPLLSGKWGILIIGAHAASNDPVGEPLR